MTYATVITADHATEEPRGFTHSPVSRDFSALLIALRRAVEAELDTLEIDVFDVAFKNWIDVAQARWRCVDDISRHIIGQKPTRLENDALMQVAFMIAASLQTENAEDCVAYRQLVDNFTRIDHGSRLTPTGRRVGRMIDSAVEQFRTLDRLLLTHGQETEAQTAAM